MCWIMSLNHCLFPEVWNWQQQVNPELKNVVGKELLEVVIPKWLADFEDMLKKKGTFFGGKVRIPYSKYLPYVFCNPRKKLKSYTKF